MRFDQDYPEWRLRPLAMAVLGALTMLGIWALVDVGGSHVNGKYIAPTGWDIVDGQAGPTRQAFAVFLFVAAGSFILTVERVRWLWSLLFAIGWGAVLAFVGWFTSSYNSRPELFEFPFFSGAFALLLAGPLFQAARDEGAARFPYARTHRHIWSDAVIGAAALAFTGATFLLMWLLASLFDLVGIKFLKELLNKEWFSAMLAGGAAGFAVGMLRERDSLVAPLYRLALIVLSALAPVLAAGLLFFLLSLPFTGLQPLWDATKATTPILLSCAAGAFLLANIVIGDGLGEEGERRNMVMRWSALVLAPSILPLAVIAAISMGLRIEQHGWTPPRLWGVIAVAVACLYGLAYWAVIAWRRLGWEDEARRVNTAAALGLVGLALFLALPILDFGAISARDQLARLQSGKVKAADFDWSAMRFQFGPAGREALVRLAKGDNPVMARAASDALRWTRPEPQTIPEETEGEKPLASRLQTFPNGWEPDPHLVNAIRQAYVCRYGPCVVRQLREDFVVAIGRDARDGKSHLFAIRRDPKTGWIGETAFVQEIDGMDKPAIDGAAAVELRPVTREQLFINGRPTDVYRQEAGPPVPPPPVR